MGQSNIEAAIKVAKQMYDLEALNASGQGIERVSWEDLDDRDKNLRLNAIDMLVRTDWISYTRRATSSPPQQPSA